MAAATSGAATQRTVVVYLNSVVGRITGDTDKSFEWLRANVIEVASGHISTPFTRIELHTLDDEVLSQDAMVSFWKRIDSGDNNEVVVRVIVDGQKPVVDFRGVYTPHHRGIGDVLANTSYSPFDALTEMIDNSLQYTILRNHANGRPREIRIEVTDDCLTVSDTGAGIRRQHAQSLCEYGNTNSIWGDTAQSTTMTAKIKVSVRADSVETPQTPRNSGKPKPKATLENRVLAAALVSPPSKLDIQRILKEQLRGQLSVYGYGLKLALKKLQLTSREPENASLEIRSYPFGQDVGWKIVPHGDLQPILNEQALFDVVRCSKPDQDLERSGVEIVFHSELPGEILDASRTRSSDAVRRNLAQIYEPYINREVTIADVVERIQSVAADTVAVGQRTTTAAYHSESIDIVVDGKSLVEELKCLNPPIGTIERLRRAKDVFRVVIHLDLGGQRTVEVVVLAFYYPFDGEPTNPFQRNLDIFWQGRRLPKVNSGIFPLFSATSKCWEDQDSSTIRQILESGRVHVLVFVPLEFRPEVNKTNLVMTDHKLKVLAAILGGVHPFLANDFCDVIRPGMACHTCAPAKALRQRFGQWLKKCNTILDKEYLLQSNGAIKSPGAVIEKGKPIKLVHRRLDGKEILGIFLTAKSEGRQSKFKEEDSLEINIKIQEECLSRDGERFSTRDYSVFSATTAELEAERRKYQSQRATKLSFEKLSDKVEAGSLLVLKPSIENAQGSRLSAREMRDWSFEGEAICAEKHKEKPVRISSVEGKLRFLLKTCGHYQVILRASKATQKLNHEQNVEVLPSRPYAVAFMNGDANGGIESVSFGSTVKLRFRLQDKFENDIPLSSYQRSSVQLDCRISVKGDAQEQNHTREVIMEALSERPSMQRSELVKLVTSRLSKFNALGSRTPMNTVSNAITVLVKEKKLALQKNGLVSLVSDLQRTSAASLSRAKRRHTLEDHEIELCSPNKLKCANSSIPSELLFELDIVPDDDSNLEFNPPLRGLSQYVLMQVSELQFHGLSLEKDAGPMSCEFRLYPGPLCFLAPKLHDGDDVLELKNASYDAAALSKFLNKHVGGRDSWNNMVSAAVSANTSLSNSTLECSQEDNKFRSTLVGKTFPIPDGRSLCKRVILSVPLSIAGEEVNEYAVLEMSHDVVCVPSRDPDNIITPRRYKALLGERVPCSQDTDEVIRCRALAGTADANFSKTLQSHAIVLESFVKGSLIAFADAIAYGGHASIRSDSLVVLSKRCVCGPISLANRDLSRTTVRDLCELAAGSSHVAQDLLSDLKDGTLWLSANGGLLCSMSGNFGGWAPSDVISSLLDYMYTEHPADAVTILIAPNDIALAGTTAKAKVIAGRVTDSILAVADSSNDAQCTVARRPQAIVPLWVTPKAGVMELNISFHPACAQQLQLLMFSDSDGCRVQLPSSFKNDLQLMLRAVDEVHQGVSTDGIVKWSSKSFVELRGGLAEVSVPVPALSREGTEITFDAIIGGVSYVSRLHISFKPEKATVLDVGFDGSLVAGDRAKIRALTQDKSGMITDELLTVVEFACEQLKIRRTRMNNDPDPALWSFPLPCKAGEFEFQIFATPAGALEPLHTVLIIHIAAGPLHCIKVTHEHSEMEDLDTLMCENGATLPNLTITACDQFENLVPVSKLKVVSPKELSLPNEIVLRDGSAILSANAAVSCCVVPPSAVAVTLKLRRSRGVVRKLLNVAVSASGRAAKLIRAHGANKVIEVPAGNGISNIQTLVQILEDDGKTVRPVNALKDDLQVVIKSTPKELERSLSIVDFAHRLWQNSGSFKVEFKLDTDWCAAKSVPFTFEVLAGCASKVEWRNVPRAVCLLEKISGSLAFFDSYGNNVTGSCHSDLSLEVWEIFEDDSACTPFSSLVTLTPSTSKGVVLFDVPGRNYPGDIELVVTHNSKRIGTYRIGIAAAKEDTGDAEKRQLQRDLSDIASRIEMTEQMLESSSRILNISVPQPDEVNFYADEMRQEKEAHGLLTPLQLTSSTALTIADIITIKVLNLSVKRQRSALQIGAAHWLARTLGVDGCSVPVISMRDSGSAASAEGVDGVHIARGVIQVSAKACSESFDTNGRVRLSDVLARRRIVMGDNSVELQANDLVSLWRAIEESASDCWLVDHAADGLEVCQFENTSACRSAICLKDGVCWRTVSPNLIVRSRFALSGSSAADHLELCELGDRAHFDVLEQLVTQLRELSELQRSRRELLEGNRQEKNAVVNSSTISGSKRILEENTKVSAASDEVLRQEEKRHRRD